MVRVALFDGGEVHYCGWGGLFGFEIADQLADSEHLDIEVIDLCSLRPLDRETIVNSEKKTHAAVMLEDDWLTYGIGAEIAATISDGAFDYLDAPVRRVAMAEVPMPYAKSLESAAMPSEHDVIQAIYQTLDAIGHRRSKTSPHD